MPARVYECDQSEAKELKKLLSYDPYLDPNLIPKSREYGKEELDAMSAEERDAVAKKEAETQEKIRALRGDRLANVIFARQECDLREGPSIGADGSKSYLYVKAPEDFFGPAEEKLGKEFKTVKRAPLDIEKKFIAMKEEEESQANAGFGSIFG